MLIGGLFNLNICDVTIPANFPIQTNNPTAELRIGVGYSSVAHAHRYDETMMAQSDLKIKLSIVDQNCNLRSIILPKL